MEQREPSRGVLLTGASELLRWRPRRLELLRFDAHRVRCCISLLLLFHCRVLTAIKERYAAAKTGHDLLKRKSDAIKVNLNNILKKILVTKRRVGVSIKESFFSFTEAHWAAGDFNNIVIENTKEASYRIRTKINNVAGVKLPVFDRAISTNTGKGQ